MSAPATRARLIASAGSIFADVGYQAATTRQICVLANANAAAVHYHFGDKLGLYTAVLNHLIVGEEERVAEHSLLKLQPESALRGFISLMSHNLNGDDVPDQYTRIMLHELSQPTAGLTVVVEAIIRPRARLLCRIIADLMDRSPRELLVRLCAHSIIGQIVHYTHARPVIKLMWPGWRMTAHTRNLIVDHVTEFSLAAVKSVARRARTKKSHGTRRRP